MISRFLFAALAVPSLVLTTTAFAFPASAQIDLGTDKIKEVLKLNDKDPREIAVQLINVSISFLSILFVILILHAGFMFMISGGDKEKTDKAKRAILNAIIGLALVLSAWSITTFALSALINATT